MKIPEQALIYTPHPFLPVKLSDPYETYEGFCEGMDNLMRAKDPTDSRYVHGNQLDAAQRVLWEWYSGSSRWVMLMAEMQSGKSGTFCSIPHILNKNPFINEKLGIATDRSNISFYLLTGMNDIDLMNQFTDDIKGYVDGAGEYSVLGNTQLRHLLKDLEGPNGRKGLKKYQKDCLYIIDESHYGSDKEQVLHKFLSKVLGIDPSNVAKGLEENNLYILSVSATPMAESLGEDSLTPYKSKVRLYNSAGYVGISELFEQSRVFKSHKLDDYKGMVSFMDEVGKIPDKVGYYIVRSTAKAYGYAKKFMNVNHSDWAIIPFDSGNNDKGTDINSILSDKPDKPTLIFIKGMLRAGKRMDCSYIKMTWDTPSSASDTVAQSLLGRVCGYNKPQDIRCYCDIQSAESYRQWVEGGFEGFTGTAKNVAKTSKGKQGQFVYWSHDKDEFGPENTREVRWFNVPRSDFEHLQCPKGNWIEYIERRGSDIHNNLLLSWSELMKVDKVLAWPLFHEYISQTSISRIIQSGVHNELDSQEKIRRHLGLPVESSFNVARRPIPDEFKSMLDSKGISFIQPDITPDTGELIITVIVSMIGGKVTSMRVNSFRAERKVLTTSELKPKSMFKRKK